MKWYKSRPVQIQAQHWNGSTPNAEYIVSWILEEGGTARFKCGGQCCENELAIYIDTLEGRMKASPQDYVIRGTKGEFYPCKPDVFYEKYEEVKVHG
jgi:hypothetical protein